MALDTLVHIFQFLAAGAVIWFFTGRLIEAVERVARRFGRSSFTVAFFILGILTSVSEFSVAVNATLDNVPQLSVGNLVGASFIIPLFVIPLLAIFGHGISLRHTISNKNLAFALLTAALPVLFTIDGTVTPKEGGLALLAYGTLIIAVRNQRDSFKKIEVMGQKLMETRSGMAIDSTTIILGMLAVFAAGNILVDQAVYFAGALNVPNSVVGILLLSFGTNIPEIFLTIRSVLKRRTEIAFGDYIGSATANTPIFGLLAIGNGSFSIEQSVFVVAAPLSILGFGALYYFAQSNRTISQKEGWYLLLFAALFFGAELFNLVRIAL